MILFLGPNKIARRTIEESAGSSYLEAAARPQVEIAPAIHLRAAAWQVDLRAASVCIQHSSRPFMQPWMRYSQNRELLSAFQVTHGHFLQQNAAAQGILLFSGPAERAR